MDLFPGESEEKIEMDFWPLMEGILIDYGDDDDEF
jgi:hypothetical protein